MQSVELIHYCFRNTAYNSFLKNTVLTGGDCFSIVYLLNLKKINFREIDFRVG